MKQRIIGIDVARALAVIGMIIVNFKVVFGKKGSSWLTSFAGVFDGKAAATFVVLAGVGIALMTKSALKNNDFQKLKRIRIQIAKRALFLFILGLLYIIIWPADILHFYGIYMLIILSILSSNERTILILAIILIVLYPLLISVFKYEIGWDFDTLNYVDFWTLKGFVRNLFFNGFHPVIPWSSFMLFGFWFGKQDLTNERFVTKAFWISGLTFVVIHVFSELSILILSDDNPHIARELIQILGTSPMPPLPIYMFNGIAISVLIISACIIIGRRFSTNKIILALHKTGQLALTFYVFHVVIGMGIIEITNPKKMGDYTIKFSITYALVFSLGCVLFAIYWLKNNKNGPIEWIMKKIIK